MKRFNDRLIYTLPLKRMYYKNTVWSKNIQSCIVMTGLMH